MDFIGIGAMKSGTTWLIKVLRNQGEFDLPRRKEFHYWVSHPKYHSWSPLKYGSIPRRFIYRIWIREFTRQLFSAIKKGNFKKFNDTFHYFFAKANDSWYSAFFTDRQGFTGEYSPSYSALDQPDIRRMHSLFPDVKLIFIIRNPVERGWSHYNFNQRNKKRFKPAFKSLVRFSERNNVELLSNYTRTLYNFTSVYKPDSILVGFYDAIIQKPHELIEGIVAFICDQRIDVDSNPFIKKRVWSTKKGDIPADYKKFLSQKYAPLMNDLSFLFEGYCLDWLDGKSSDNGNKPFVVLNKTHLSKIKSIAKKNNYWEDLSTSE